MADKISALIFKALASDGEKPRASKMFPLTIWVGLFSSAPAIAASPVSIAAWPPRCHGLPKIKRGLDRSFNPLHGCRCQRAQRRVDRQLLLDRGRLVTLHPRVAPQPPLSSLQLRT